MACTEGTSSGMTFPDCLLGLWLIAAERALFAGAAKVTLWLGFCLEHHFCHYLPGTQYKRYRPLYPVELCPPGVNKM